RGLAARCDRVVSQLVEYGVDRPKTPPAFTVTRSLKPGLHPAVYHRHAGQNHLAVQRRERRLLAFADDDHDAVAVRRSHHQPIAFGLIRSGKQIRQTDHQRGPATTGQGEPTTRGVDRIHQLIECNLPRALVWFVGWTLWS